LYYNNARDKKEANMEKIRLKDPDGFLKLKFNYTNNSLEEFVTAENEIDKTIEFKDEFIQKLDPVYMIPKHGFIKAHFYSPVKNIFGRPVDTLIVNVIVLWVMTILMYLALYFRLLKKFLDSGEVAMGRKMKGVE
jgi:hypothetical protein